jgi:hypothetical protein
LDVAVTAQRASARPSARSSGSPSDFR